MKTRNLGKKRSHLLLQGTLLLLIYGIIYMLDSNDYLFEWIRKNSSFYLIFSICILLVSHFLSYRLGFALIIGHGLGILVGHFLGEALLKASLSRIQPSMSAEEIHRLSIHQGFPIWMGCVLLSALIYGFIWMLLKRRKKSLMTNS